MSVHYSGLLTASKLSQLCAEIEQTFSSWYDAWFVQGRSSLTLALNHSGDKLFEYQTISLTEQNTLLLEDDFALVADSAAKTQLPQLAMAVNAQSEGDSRLLEHVGDKMFAKLAAQLTQPNTQSGTKVNSAHVNRPKGAFNSALSLLVSVAGHNLTLHLSAAYLHLFGQKQPVNKAPLAPLALKGCSEAKTVGFELTLQSEQISVGQLMALQVGHVIVLKQQIKEPLSLTSGEGKTQLKGYLVKKDQQKAVFITGIGK